jgi:hypothetical protein
MRASSNLGRGRRAAARSARPARRFLASSIVAAIFCSAVARPAFAEIVRTDAELAGKNFCWALGADSEQYGRDHSYVYSYVFSYSVQIVLHGVWSIRDGVVTLKLDGGVTATRRYDIDGEHVTELTGSLMGSAAGGANRGVVGHVC